MTQSVAVSICMDEITRIMKNFPLVTSTKINDLCNFLINISKTSNFTLKGHHVHLQGLPIEYIMPIAEWIATLAQVLSIMKPTYKDFYERIDMCEIVSFMTRLNQGDLTSEEIHNLINIHLNSTAQRLFFPHGETVFGTFKDEASEMVAKILTDPSYRPKKILPSPWGSLPVKSIPLIKRFDLERDPIKTITQVIEKNDAASIVIRCPEELTKEHLLMLASIEVALEHLNNIYVIVVSKGTIGLKQNIFSWQVTFKPPTAEFLASRFVNQITNIPYEYKLDHTDMLAIFKGKEKAVVECFDSLLNGYVRDILSQPLDVLKESRDDGDVFKESEKSEELNKLGELEELGNLPSLSEVSEVLGCSEEPPEKGAKRLRKSFLEHEPIRKRRKHSIANMEVMLSKGASTMGYYL